MMDETGEFSKTIPDIDDDKLALNKRSTITFQERTSIASFCKETDDFYLQLKQQKELVSERPVIPSTKMERLSFYRAYISSPCKTQILCAQRNRFNPFLWYYLMNILLKSLPHTFVHMFLASYAQEEHIFLPKMLPICHGFKYFVILASFFDLIMYLDNLTIVLHYAVTSILYDNPWNTCSQEYYFDVYPKTVRCLELDDLAKYFTNKTNIYFDGHLYYLSNNNQSVTLPQLIFYRQVLKNESQFHVYCLFIWLILALIDTQVRHRRFWKLLNRCQWLIICIDLLSFIYTLTEYKNLRGLAMPYSYMSDLWDADLDLLAESTSAPPVVHVLTARSTQKIYPSGDSAVIILSNTLYFLFRGLVSHRVKVYCSSYVGLPIFYSYLNEQSWFYFYPIFFSTFDLGNLYTKIFFVTNCLSECLTMTVTYHCFVETISYEWKSVKRWIPLSILTIVGFTTFIIADFLSRVSLYLVTKSLATLYEIIFIYLLYPLGRFFDDYMFHTGEQITTLRILSLRIVPVFYFMKVYKLWNLLIDAIDFGLFNHLWALGALAVGPFIFGALCAFFTRIIRNGQNWSVLFRPSPTWGPRDYDTRRIRKQYDSRYYIGSQYPRQLSRHMLRMSEPELYTLDLRYDVDRRPSQRTTIAQPQDVKIEDEKKEE